MKENSTKVLVVDDEPNIVELLTVSLKFQGFEVATATSGLQALEVAPEFKPDAFILDVMMPGMDGFELLPKLRALGFEGPVLFLTAKDAVEHRIHGLTIGADDYVTKPFSLEEVITRLRVILRRGAQVAEEVEDDNVLTYDDLVLNDDTHEVTKGGTVVELSPTEFNLLRYLMLNAEVVLSKPKILDNVWHYDFGGDGNVVESYISYLRRNRRCAPDSHRAGCGLCAAETTGITVFQGTIWHDTRTPRSAARITTTARAAAGVVAKQEKIKEEWADPAGTTNGHTAAGFPAFCHRHRRRRWAASQRRRHPTSHV